MNVMTTKPRSRIVSITPKLARKYLANNNSNRNVRPSKVIEYRRQMEKGYWHLTPQGVSLCGSGNLLDGQHRLMAVVEYGEPVDMVVTSGVDPIAQQYMDSGIRRSVADNLAMHDGVKNSTRTAAIARALNLFDSGAYHTLVLNEARLIISEYKDSLDWCATLPQKALPRSAYFLAPLVWIHGHGWGDCAEEFAHALSTMEGLSKGSPVIALHRAINRTEVGGGGSSKAIGLSMLTFNALHVYAEEESVSNVLLSTVGFDYFNSDIKTFPKRRSESTCRHHRGCTFSYTSAEKLCYLHNKFRTKKRRKK